MTECTDQLYEYGKALTKGVNVVERHDDDDLGSFDAPPARREQGPSSSSKSGNVSFGGDQPKEGSGEQSPQGGGGSGMLIDEMTADQRIDS
eukprot:6936089-Karenia_brevis.AAC.1